jgi:L-fucose dehydrogenase
VNNAAINDKVGLEHGSAQEFMRSLERNLLHYYIMAYYSVPHLKRPRGSICQRRFENGAHRSGRSSGYVASKRAIFGITRECATVPYSIRVNAVVPAEVVTPLYQQRLQSLPLRRKN